MKALRDQRTSDTDQPLALARSLGAAMGVMVIGGAALWQGQGGALAASLGVSLSLLNLWAIERLGARAVHRAASEGPQVALSALTGGLAIKTGLLLGGVCLAIRSLGGSAVPFTIGLLTFVFALLAAGLWSARKAA